jgi:hypothetical protein
MFALAVLASSVAIPQTDTVAKKRFMSSSRDRPWAGPHPACEGTRLDVADRRSRQIGFNIVLRHPSAAGRLQEPSRLASRRGRRRRQGLAVARNAGNVWMPQAGHESRFRSRREEPAKHCPRAMTAAIGMHRAAQLVQWP